MIKIKLNDKKKFDTNFLLSTNLIMILHGTGLLKSEYKLIKNKSYKSKKIMRNNKIENLKKIFELFFIKKDEEFSLIDGYNRIGGIEFNDWKDFIRILLKKEILIKIPAK